jgi:hypothetical protein
MTSKPSQPWMILPPTVGKPTTAAGLVVYHGGSGENVTAPLVDSLKFALVAAIRAAGYVMASSSAHGANFGTDADLADYAELEAYCADVWKISRVIHLSQSMGGLSGMLTASNRLLPVRGWVGIYPVCNLANMYANPSFTAAIKTAYGIAEDGSDYAAKTAGHDPVLLIANKFGGLRMRFYASPDDTVVPKASHSDPMKLLVAGVTLESDVVVCTGEHGDPSHFQAADCVSFLSRCL